MSLQACADIVARGDPDRFAAAMAAPVDARRVLFPIYAFNVEVARAPWVTSEPMIGEMRLQWWRDVLEEIGQGRPVRRHEVTMPLAEVLDSEGAATLDRLVQARRWDLYRDPFEDEAHFDRYLGATGAGLMWVAARACASTRVEQSEDMVRDFGHATAFVRFLQAVPDLESRGRIPLVDGRAEAIARSARALRDRIADAKALRLSLVHDARPAVLEGWQTHPLLEQIARDPARVAEGRVGLSPVRKRTRLLRWS